MSLKQKFIFSAILMLLGVFFGILACYVALPLLLVAILFSLVGRELMFRWNRCPNCGSWLGWSGIPDSCPACRIAINPDEKSR